ncbi:hypothetical protein BV22DRAFT_1121771 [Leucogyrophana mollusca]|uniref:Uncharacterized protein n=1 Tax=Leucogyrophana mollusca TaxID=85980 RepID=A0ACB8B9X7_9AGAM|nr:hypothetical protein BV22DRAFT_1121771 [Leucogyrophana mollusca]
MPIFDGVYYLLSPSLSPARRTELQSILDLNGALPAAAQSTRLTHVVTNTPHFDGAHSVKDGVKVVSDRWVDRSVIMGKLQLEQYYSPDPSMLFSGVVACATDLPGPDLEVLSAGITALGGQWRQGLTRDVTHLFALHTNSDKYTTALHFRPHTHMILLTPHWFDDSVRLGRVLPTEAYEWPEPRVLLPSHVAPTHDPSDANLDAEGSNRKRKRSAETADTTTDGGAEKAEDRKIWDGRRILLSRSLELSTGHRAAVEAGIRRAGGVVVGTRDAAGEGKDKGVNGDDEDEDEEARLVDECDVLVTRFRSGKAYFKAARLPRLILIGTLVWLFSVDSSGTLSAPTDNLLWYPVPRNGIKGLRGVEITITNYTGAARDYLKKLISLMGAKFTPSMSASNKVLVAGFTPSPKTDRALAWSIPIVNHTWLEDCFVQWRNLTPAMERYIGFPPGVDFGKLLTGTMAGEKGSIGGRCVGAIDVDAEEERDREAGVLEKQGGVDVGAEVGLNGAGDKDGEVERRSKPRSRKATDEVDEPEQAPKPKSTTKAAPPKPASAKPKSAPSGSKPVSASVPLGTNTSVRDAQEVEEEVGFGGGDDGMDIDEPPPKSKSTPKPKSSAKSRKAPESDKDDSDENPSPRKSKARAPRASPSPGSTPPPRKKLLRRSEIAALKAKAGADSDAEIEGGGKGKTKGDSGTEDSDVPGPARSVGKAKAKAETSAKPRGRPAKKAPAKAAPSSADEAPPHADDNDLPPAKSKPSTAPKKPTPKAGPKPRLESPSSSSSDDIYTRPGKPQPSTSKPTAPSTSKPTAPSTSKTTAPSKPPAKPARSPTRSPSPPPPKTIKTPKRTVSVLVPPLPKDYFSPGKPTSGAAQAKDLARTGSIRASAAEASTSSSATRPRPRTTHAHAGDRDVVDSSFMAEAESPASVRAPSKRGAASRATTKLRNEIMPDVLQYEKQVKNAKRRRPSEVSLSFAVGGGRGEEDDEEGEEGGREAKRKRVEKGKGKKRAVEEDEEEVEEEEEEAEVEDVVSPPRAKPKPKPAKKGKTKVNTASDDEMSVDEYELAVKKKIAAQTKQAKAGSQEKKSGSQPSKKGDAGAGDKSGSGGGRDIRMMTTQVTLSEDVLKRLAKLGVKATARPSECTHLVAKSIVRTEKFLCAMAVSPFVLSEDWAVGSARAGRLLPEDEHTLSDSEAEKKWGFKLADALRRAKGPGGGARLFAQMTFYVTPKVAIDVKLLRNVIAAAGGQVQTQTPTPRILSGKPHRHVISCAADAPIWRPLVREGVPVYAPELVLAGVLRQEVRWGEGGVRVG